MLLTPFHGRTKTIWWNRKKLKFAKWKLFFFLEKASGLCVGVYVPPSTGRTFLPVTSSSVKADGERIERTSDLTLWKHQTSNTSNQKVFSAPALQSKSLAELSKPFITEIHNKNRLNYWCLMSSGSNILLELDQTHQGLLCQESKGNEWTF